MQNFTRKTGLSGNNGTKENSKMAEAKIGTNGIAQRTDVNENNFSLKNKKGRSQEQF